MVLYAIILILRNKLAGSYDVFFFFVSFGVEEG